MSESCFYVYIHVLMTKNPLKSRKQNVRLGKRTGKDLLYFLFNFQGLRSRVNFSPAFNEVTRLKRHWSDQDTQHYRDGYPVSKEYNYS